MTEVLRSYLKKLGLIARIMFGRVRYQDLTETFEIVLKEENEWAGGK